MRSPDFLSTFLLAQQAPPPAGNSATPLLMMILMFVIMYFLLIRPQRVRQRELEARIAKIKTGDKIVSTAGIHGLVTNVKERTLMVKVDAKNNVKVELEKSAVANIFPKGEGKPDDEPEAAEGEDDSPSDPESAKTA